MPNHIQNRLKLIGTNEEIKDVRSFLQSTEPIEVGEHKGKSRLFFDGQEIELMINDIYDVKEAITFFEALTEGNKL